MFRAAGVRGRKVPPRGPSVPCEGHHSPSVSVVCGHPAALRSSAAGSLPLRKSALYLAAIPPHLRRGEPRRKCSGRPGGSRSGCWRRQCRNKSATDCAGRSVQGSIRCRERRTAIRASEPSRLRPVRPSAYRTMPVFVGVWEPEVSQPLHRQSPPSPPHQTASPATLHFVPRPWSLGDSKPGSPHQGQHTTDRRHPPDRPVLETPSNQGQPGILRPRHGA